MQNYALFFLVLNNIYYKLRPSRSFLEGIQVNIYDTNCSRSRGILRLNKRVLYLRGVVYPTV